MRFLTSIPPILFLLLQFELTFCAQFDDTMMQWANEVADGDVETLLAGFVDPKENLAADIASAKSTRVRLEPNHRLIDANYVADGQDPKHFIATVCPKEGEIYDFWSMVAQAEVHRIVMLDEGCEKYWPDESSDYQSPRGSGSKIHLKVESEEKLDEHLITRKMHITVENRTRPRLNKEWTVEHIQWLGWPKDGVPSEEHDINNLMTKFMDKEKTRVLFHCADGAGQSGTIMTIYLAMEQLFLSHHLDLPKVVKKLRSQRPGSVKTKEQFLYIHSALMRIAVDQVQKMVSKIGSRIYPEGSQNSHTAKHGSP